ncbi:hypothetical protein HNY73_010356 [Argiope bruennichi]|uniref:Uncharacterized protein n=1 Tax=Argiope bruennichi TaxID=94029 RepID=A0A8T0F2M7_ARGBR|nr:hypothetical protein HNY73_010356 [Argiope bruennichi]
MERAPLFLTNEAISLSGHEIWLWVRKFSLPSNPNTSDCNEGHLEEAVLIGDRVLVLGSWAIQYQIRYNEISIVYVYNTHKVILPQVGVSETIEERYVVPYVDLFF